MFSRHYYFPTKNKIKRASQVHKPLLPCLVCWRPEAMWDFCAHSRRGANANFTANICGIIGSILFKPQRKDFYFLARRTAFPFTQVLMCWQKTVYILTHTHQPLYFFFTNNTPSFFSFKSNQTNQMRLTRRFATPKKLSLSPKDPLPKPYTTTQHCTVLIRLHTGAKGATFF